MLRLGMRVIANDEYMKQFPRTRCRGGVLIGDGAKTKECWVVKWDALKTPQTVHEKFLEPEDFRSPGT